MAGLDLNQLAFALNAAGKAKGAIFGSDPLARVFSGLGLGTSGAGALGSYTGSQALSQLGQLGGQALGAAGLGYGIYNIANDPTLSTKQKAGSAALAATDAAQLLIPYYGAIYGGTLAVDALGNQLEKSGSPQLRSTGHALTAPLLPIEGFRNVISGRQSPREAANTTIAQMRQVPILSKIYNPILDAFGLGTKPTHGTMFRNDMTNVAGQIPELKGFDVNKGGFAKFMDPKQYDAYSLDDRMAAMRLANYMAPASHEYDNPKLGPAFSGQLQRALLGNFGDKLPGIAQNAFNRINTPQQAAPQKQAPALPIAPAGQFGVDPAAIAKWRASQGGSGVLVAQANNILAGMGAH